MMAFIAHHSPVVAAEARSTMNEFAQKLMECHREEMIAVVNIPKPRATALDKWEFLEAYKQELQHLAARCVDLIFLTSCLTIS